MDASKIAVTVSRTAGLTLLNHGIVVLAGSTPDSKVTKRGLWQRGAGRVFGDVVDTPGFAAVEAVLGAALVIVVPRLLRAR
ncbi:hypothetical protein [Demequina activiva]|uniref:Uncharacterized protein n=1 Tax=Demequina activiva TaxID=1582364 RepID=A0A919UHH0_9MICO|nr:hypothetical protein [Demequina activiva]GIG55434.1 hypothetical protein Dac01nite_21860 [Demequina activiva]